MSEQPLKATMEWKEEFCVHTFNPPPSYTYKADIIDGFNGVYLDIDMEVYDVEEGKQVVEAVYNELGRLEQLRILRLASYLPPK